MSARTRKNGILVGVFITPSNFSKLVSAKKNKISYSKVIGEALDLYFSQEREIILPKRVIRYEESNVKVKI